MARQAMRSFRAPQEVAELLDSEAAKAGLDVSAWLREVIVVVAASGLTLPQLIDYLGLVDTEPTTDNGQYRYRHYRWFNPKPKLGRSVYARTCRHGPQSVTQFATFDRCECGMERQR